MSALTIRPATVDEIFDAPGVEALLHEYATESAITGTPLAWPSREVYTALHATGFSELFGAFHGDELIGFLFLIVTVNPHYSKPLAVTESYFVAQRFRKTGAGLRLMKAAEAEAASRGAIGFLISAPNGGRLASVLPRTGYKETNRVFFKALP